MVQVVRVEGAAGVFRVDDKSIHEAILWSASTDRAVRRSPNLEELTFALERADSTSVQDENILVIEGTLEDSPMAGWRVEFGPFTLKEYLLIRCQALANYASREARKEQSFLVQP